MSEILQEGLKRTEQGETVALVTIIETKGSTPRKVGSKMLVGKDGLINGTIGGGITEARVIEEAKKSLQEGKGKILSYSLTREAAALEEGAICGGEMKLFIDILTPKEEVIIFGAGHISVYVSELAKMLGFKVTIIDERKEFANQERFPETDRILTEEVEEALKLLEITPSTYIIIVTRGHLKDEEVLAGVIKTKACYIGMIGSRKKNETVFQHLREKGITEEELEKVYAPIGLDIGAQTPEEIAVSIMAEIIQVRRKEV
ncbi:MAG: XdhC/CoxI family protein [Candidatus Caldatribacteriota bacterium]